MSAQQPLHDLWGEVLGQPAALGALRAALARDEVAHAWLLAGPPGVGQRELTRAFAAALNCPGSTGDLPCGGCDTCRRIARGVHPAVVDLEPEGRAHVVGSIREEWVPLATRTMTEGRRRVLRVVAADRMNEAAQNAFLKLLEEPPPSVVWVLEAEEEGLLLDTVVSRCRRLAVLPWRPDAMAALADRLGVAPDRQTSLVRASLGSPERLRDLADPEVAEARRHHLAILDRLATGGPGQVVPIARELTGWAKERSKALKEVHAEQFAELEASFGVENDRGWPPGVKQRLTRRFERLERQERHRALTLALSDLASYLRDLLAVGAGASADRLVNLDHVDELRRDVDRLPAPDAVRVLSAVAACEEALERNGNPDLQLERLLLRLALPIYAAAA